MTVKRRVEKLEGSSAHKVRYAVSEEPEGYPEDPDGLPPEMTDEEWEAAFCGESENN